MWSLPSWSTQLTGRRTDIEVIPSSKVIQICHIMILYSLPASDYHILSTTTVSVLGSFPELRARYDQLHLVAVLHLGGTKSEEKLYSQLITNIY